MYVAYIYMYKYIHLISFVRVCLCVFVCVCVCVFTYVEGYACPGDFFGLGGARPRQCSMCTASPPFALIYLPFKFL